MQLDKIHLIQENQDVLKLKMFYLKILEKGIGLLGTMMNYLQ